MVPPFSAKNLSNALFERFFHLLTTKFTTICNSYNALYEKTIRIINPIASQLLKWLSTLPLSTLIQHFLDPVLSNLDNCIQIFLS